MAYFRSIPGAVAANIGDTQYVGRVFGVDAVHAPAQDQAGRLLFGALRVANAINALVSGLLEPHQPQAEIGDRHQQDGYQHHDEDERQGAGEYRRQ